MDKETRDFHYRKAELIAEHYKNTFDRTLQVWRDRNQTFLYLIAVAAITGVLTLQVPDTDTLFLEAIISLLNITDAARVDEFKANFPFTILNTVLLALIFYLMVILYHRTFNLVRNYEYLARLEGELRELLELSDNEVAFTRESLFYKNNKHWGQTFTRYIYFIVVFILLFVVAIGVLPSAISSISSIINNFNLQMVWGSLTSVFNIVLIIAILVLYIAYITANYNIFNMEASLTDEEQRQEKLPDSSVGETTHIQLDEES